ncbi:MAG: CDP-archaeol synthase [Candidatus Woesearchaeota archaeon]
MYLPAFIANNLFFIIPAYLTTFFLFFGVLLVKVLSKRIAWLKPFLFPIDCNASFQGKRLIGDHKIAAGWVMPLVASLLSFWMAGNFALMFLISYFCFFGDLAGSFLKRRLDLEEHEPLLVVDQLSFFLGGYVAAYALGSRIPGNELLLLALLTFVVHFSGNIILSKLKMKNMPY